MKNRPYLSPTLIKCDRFCGRQWHGQAAWKAWEACAVHRGRGSAGRSSEKQQETPQANKNGADSYAPGVLGTLKGGKIKWWLLYKIFVELESYFLGVVTANDTENRIEIA